MTDASASDAEATDAAGAREDAAAAHVLVGYYDVWITAPQRPGCTLAGSSRLNLIVTERDGSLTAHLFEDGHWSYGARTRMTLEPTGENPLIVTMPCVVGFGDVPPGKARLVIESLILDGRDA